MSFNKIMDVILYRTAVRDNCIFWAFTSRFYTRGDRWRILWLAFFQKRPLPIPDHFPMDMTRVEVVNLISHWVATDSLITITKRFEDYCEGEGRDSMTVLTADRISRHLKYWRMIWLGEDLTEADEIP